MATYLGKRSLDSEMSIDLENGKILFDYSLNKFQDDILDSNHSFFDFGNDVEYPTTKTQILKRIFKELYLDYKNLFLYYVYDHLPSIRHKIQYYRQDFLIYYEKYMYGTMEYTFEGQHNSKEIIYHIPHNLWFEYELEGDYKEKIKTIELKRRFVKLINDNGIYDQQEGWNLLFTFSGIPMYGKCTIRYI